MYPVKLTFEKKTIVILQTHGDIKGSVVLSIVTRNKTQRKDTTFLNSFFLKVNAVPLSYPERKRFIFLFPGHGFFHLRYFENRPLELLVSVSSPA